MKERSSKCYDQFILSGLEIKSVSLRDPVRNDITLSDHLGDRQKKEVNRNMAKVIIELKEKCS